MIRLFSIITSLFTVEHSSSFFCFSFFKYLGALLKNAFLALVNFITKMLWEIIKFALGVMEAFEYMINQFLGINATFQDVYDQASNIGGSPNFIGTFTKTFRAIVAVSIVLLIIFTIFAIIRQEYANATSGGTQGNDKKPIIMGLFRKMMYIALLPLTMIFIITGVNSILTAFSRAMKGSVDMTIAAQMLSVATYDSNKYRIYAQQNKRVPIVIQAYNPDNYDADENDLLVKKIESLDVQTKLRTTASNIVSGNLHTFNDTLNYKNNKLTNSVEYGDFYEKFVCTAEQYQVMADFVDYAQKLNLKFQIKSIDDPNIDWKYVDSAVFNQNDISLKINYRDANDLNQDGNTNDFYTIEYSTSFEVTSPISDALDSIMALLGIDEYSDNLFKTMERDENYVNVVNWANEKVLIQLTGIVDPETGIVTKPFEVNDPTTWSRMDQLIMYEYYHFASNNTFGNYSINDLIEGVELDACQIAYREYYADSNAYSPERTIDCVKINGVYYRIEKNPYKTDKYGNIYYVLRDALTAQETNSFLNNDFSVIQQYTGRVATLKVTGEGGNFDLNNPETWSYSDQILVYEFYKDLTSGNQLYTFDFNDFIGSGVEVPLYHITHRTLNGNVSDNTNQDGDYILLNGTYYQAIESGGKYTLANPSESTIEFLFDAEVYQDSYYYNYAINLDDEKFEEVYGISTREDVMENGVVVQKAKNAKNFVLHVDKNEANGILGSFIPLSQEDLQFEKYSNFELKLSDNFDYNEVNTWTYKDYFIFYLYANYSQIAGRLGLDSLRISGLSGDIGTISKDGDTKYVFQVRYDSYAEESGPNAGLTHDLYLYLDIDAINCISNLLINNELDTTRVLIDNYINTNEKDFFTTVVDMDKLVTADSEVYMFEFSDDFAMGVPSTWTVQDYLLYYFSQQAIISNQEVAGTIEEIESMQETGYSALKYNIYKTVDSKPVLDDVVYKFGKSGSEKTVYLSRSSIKKLVDNAGNSLSFSTETDFLKMNLVDFIAKKYQTTQNSLIADDEGIINNLYQDLLPYVYDSDAIIDEIVKQISFNTNSSNDKIEVFNNISNYTYTNENVLIENLSTWTAFDAMIYLETGSVSKNYSSYLVEYAGTKYFIIGDYAVNISDTVGENPNPFKAIFEDKNMVTSIASSYNPDVDGANYNNYYQNNYKQYVYSATALDDIDIYHYTSSKFTYTKTSTLTVLDIIYNMLTNSNIIVGNTKEFEVYSDGTNNYIKITGSDSKIYFVLVSSTFNDYISLKRSSVIKNEYVIATVGAQYSAFASDVYTKLDALIYLDTADTTQKNYQMYVYNGNNYIYTGNSYLKVYDNVEQPVTSFETISGGNVVANELAAKLYTNYYEDLVMLKDNGGFGEEYNTTGQIVVKYQYNRAESDLTFKNLTPLSLILANLGLIDLNNPNPAAVDGNIIRASTGTYLSVVVASGSGESTEYYIKISDLATYTTGENKVVEEKESAIDEMLYRYLLISNKIDSINYYSEGAFYNLFATFDSDIETNLTTDRIEEISDLNQTLSHVDSFDIKNATSWTYYNLLYHYLSGKEIFTGSQILYIDTAGNRYVKVDNESSNNIFIKVGDSSALFASLFEKFTSSQVEYNIKTEPAIPTFEIREVSETVDGVTTQVKYWFVNGNNTFEKAGDAVIGANPTYTVDTVTGNWLVDGVNTGARAEVNFSPLGIIGFKTTNKENDNLDKILFAGADTADESDDKYFYYINGAYPGTEFTAVYNLDNVIIKNNSTYGNYEYTTLDIGQFGDWTVLDLIISRITALTIPSKVVSRIFIYGSNAYIYVGSAYVNLTQLGIISDSVLTNIYNNIGTADDRQTKQLSDLFSGGDVKKLTKLYNGESVGNNIFISKTNFDTALANSTPPAMPDQIDKVYFTDDFVSSDYSTWMLSDFIIYYMFDKDYENFSVVDDTLLQAGETAPTPIKNFEDMVSRGYAPARNYKYLSEDENGNTVLKDVIWLGINKKGTGSVIDQELFFRYYGRALNNVSFLDRDELLKLEIGVNTTTNTLKEIHIQKSTILNSNDFIYDNYYYFKINYTILNQLRDVTASTQQKISSGEANTTSSINFKLSENFDIEDITTWTWTDFIVVYEFSQTNIRHNYFEGMSFSDLKNDNYLPVFEENSEKVIELNGNYYNVKDINLDGDKKSFTTFDEDGNVDQVYGVSNIISIGLENEYNIKTLFESREYFVKTSNDYAVDYSKTPDTILYSSYNNIFYLSLNTNLYDNYKVNLKLLNASDNYTITNIVRNVNWPQKLMNDLQVIYPDLNWSTLIATDGWLDTLGVYYSAQSSGEFVTEGNSANITAPGLVLSEFFLSVAKTMTSDDISTHAYEYEPIFDENTIKSLMLAMLGENEYNDLSLQASIFLEMFNNMFIPVLEDIAAERGTEIVDGKIDNFYISVYKAFLSTILLSSDMGEYFYKVATRVYAQYTIFDSLASASGDYAAYIDYINSRADASGEQVTKFSYATFQELAIYENGFKGNKNPTFTFNFKSSFEYFYGTISHRSLKDNEYDITMLNLPAGYDFDSEAAKKQLSTEDVNKVFNNSANLGKLISKLDTEYDRIYMDNNSKVIDSNETGIYCFLFDVYWSIYQNVDNKNQSRPTYLQSFYKYITGNLPRWNYTHDQDITATSAYFPERSNYVKAIENTQKESIKSALKMYLPDAGDVSIDGEGSLWDRLKDLIGEATVTPYMVLKATFNSNTTNSKYKNAYKSVYELSSLAGSAVLGLDGSINEIIEKSYKGDISQWNKVNEIKDNLEIMINELKEVVKLTPGQYVEGDITRGYRSDAKSEDGDIIFTDQRYETAIKNAQALYNNISDYITNQTVLDKADKASVTFTLAQFGKNYVTEGYTFSFENKEYTMKSTANPERLAEYVYGGSFLAQFGAEAIYTNSEYNGFIENYKVYDSEDKVIKTKLEVWPELRKFVSSLANYTSRLYYLSNMNDLSDNVGDGILLTDTVYKNSAAAGTQENTTLEYMIMEYLLKSDISADTFIRLSFGDNVETLNNLGCTNEDILALAYYLEGVNYKVDEHGNQVKSNVGNTIVVVNGVDYVMTGAQKKESISEYWKLVSSIDYNSFGYYNDGTNTGTDRIHIMFKKLISYLIVSEEAEESVSENAVNLDNINFKQFRRIMMQALKDYIKNPSETDLENSNRYITLFNLVCSQFSYTYNNGTNVEAGTSVSPLYISYANNRVNYVSYGTNCPLYAEFSIDIPTRDIILTLAGIANRPIEELVGLEYGSLYDTQGNYDEAKGDTFVLTTYDEAEGKYYPIMTKSKKRSTDDKYYSYIQKYGIDFDTDYYYTDYNYPIVAKGVIDANGYPTAIKMIDNEVYFYRTGLTSSAGLGESALNRTRNGSEVTTIGYTKYVSIESSIKAGFGGSDSMAMFTGSSDMEAVLKSDGSAYFIQSEEMYRIADTNDFDSISVLDKFASFFNLEIKQVFVLLLGFATMFPILFKASGAVLRRILDLIFLVLMGPLAISTMAINPEGKDGKAKSKIFDTWKNYLSQTLLHVFGYVIAFNIYYILCSTVMNMELVHDSTMNMIYRVGGLSSFVTKSSINSLLKYVYIIAAGGAIKTCADLLVNIVTCGKANKAFETPMSKDVMADIKKVFQDFREIMEKVQGITSGKALLQAKDFAMESMKNAVPGSAAIRGAVHMGQNLATKSKAKALEKGAIANGVDPGIAKKMAKSFEMNERKQRDQKRQKHAENANAFAKNTLGMTSPIFEAPKDSKVNKPDKKKKKIKAPKNAAAKQKKRDEEKKRKEKEKQQKSGKKPEKKEEKK